jgi:hypothetical protein
MKAYSRLSSELERIRPYDVAVDAIDSKRHTIIAMNNAYVELLATDGDVLADLPLFYLNEPQLSLESFRLKQKLLLCEITAKRLSDDYVSQLIWDPMSKAVKSAESDLVDAIHYRDTIRALEANGGLSLLSDLGQEIVGLTGERQMLAWRAQTDLTQKQIEIDGQRRRLKAEQDELNQLIELNEQISDLHKYSMPRKGAVEFETYSGAFLKKGDAICAIRFD